MLTINPIDLSPKERAEQSGQTSSGTGKTFALAPLRVSTLLTRLYDLCICTGVNFKLNAVRQCHNFSTSPFFCLSDPSGISGMGYQSLTKERDAWVMEPVAATECSDLADLTSALTMAFETQDSPDRQAARQRVRSYLHDRVLDLLQAVDWDGSPSCSTRITDLDELRFREIIRCGQHGFINRQGVAVCSTECEINPRWDVCYFRVETNTVHHNSFVFAVQFADVLTSRAVCDPDNLFKSRLWAQITAVLFRGDPFAYSERPWVPSTIGFEGCAQNVAGGSTLSLPQVDRDTVRDLRDKANELCLSSSPAYIAAFLRGFSELSDQDRSFTLFPVDQLCLDNFLNHPLRFFAQIRSALGDSGELNAEEMANAVTKFIDTLEAAAQGNGDLQNDIKTINDHREDYVFLAMASWRAVESDIDLATSHAELGVPYFDIISLNQSLVGARVTQVPFNPVDDLLSYEGPAIMETAANLFFVATKGDSLGTGGYANRTLMAFDANTYGGLFSEWVARGKNDPEQMGLLRGIMGGDCVFVFEGDPDQQGRLVYPVRYTHRVQSFARGGERDKPRGTVHEFIGRFIIYKKGDSVLLDTDIEKVLRNEPFGLSQQVACQAEEKGLASFLRHDDFKIIYYLITPPSYKHRVVYYMEERMGPTFFGQIDAYNREYATKIPYPCTPTQFSFVGSRKVDINQVELSPTDPFFSDDGLTSMFESSGKAARRRYRSQNPNSFSRSLYTSWEKVDHLWFMRDLGLLG